MLRAAKLMVIVRMQHCNVYRAVAASVAVAVIFNAPSVRCVNSQPASALMRRVVIARQGAIRRRRGVVAILQFVCLCRTTMAMLSGISALRAVWFSKKG